MITKSEKQFRAISYIFLIVLGLLFSFPFYLIVINSFKPEISNEINDILINTLSLPSVLDLQYLKEGYETVNFTSAFFTSLMVTSGATVAITLVSSMFAWILVRTKTKLSQFFFYLVVIAMLVPFQMVMFPLVRVMSWMGLDNAGGLIFMYMGFGLSLSTVLFHGFTKSVPLEIEEAAFMDGANIFQVFFLIIFRMLKPIIVTTAILNVIWIWNDFMLPYLILQESETIPLAMMRLSTRYSIRWELYMPVVLLSVIPVVCFYFLAQKHIIKGIAAGAIK